MILRRIPRQQRFSRTAVLRIREKYCGDRTVTDIVASFSFTTTSTTATILSTITDGNQVDVLYSLLGLQKLWLPVRCRPLFKWS
jgi:hypothetical protein